MRVQRSVGAWTRYGREEGLEDAVQRQIDRCLHEDIPGGPAAYATASLEDRTPALRGCIDDALQALAAPGQQIVQPEPGRVRMLGVGVDRLGVCHSQPPGRGDGHLDLRPSGRRVAMCEGLVRPAHRHGRLTVVDRGRRRDAGQADRAWEGGVFGFMPPTPGESQAGVTRGAGTGLGLSSWTYDRPPVYLASWHKSVFIALVVISNLDAATFKAATASDDDAEVIERFVASELKWNKRFAASDFPAWLSDTKKSIKEVRRISRGPGSCDGKFESMFAKESEDLPPVEPLSELAAMFPGKGKR